MPRQRLQVESGLRAPISRAAASQVDTFVRPGPNKLEQLAQGLAEIAPSVGRFSSVVADRMAAEETLKGETARRKAHEEGLTLAEAQRAGKIPAQSNPWFMAGLKEQDGRVSADTWHTDFIESLAKDGQMDTSTDLKDFDEFVNKHRSSWLEQKVGEAGRDEHFEVGFGHRSDAYLDEERRKFASRIEDRLKGKSDDAHFQEIKKHVRDSLKSADLTQIAGDIDVLNDSVIRQGRDKTRTNQTAVQAIVAAAVEFDDPIMGNKVLELLKHVNAGSGKVGDTKFGSDAFQKAKEQINDQAWQKNQRAWTENEQHRTLRSRELLGGAVKTLLQNPHADLSKFVVGAKDMPDVVADLVNLQRNSNSLQFRTDENIKRDLYSRIWTTGDISEQYIVQQLNSNYLTTPDADWLIDQLANARRAKEGDLKDIFDDWNFRQELSNISGRFADKLGIIGGTEKDKAAQAEAVFRQRWFELNANGEAGKMSQQDRIKWLSDQSASIVGQQRGPDVLKITDAPAPEFNTPEALRKRLPDTLVLTEDDLRESRSGSVSPTLKAHLKRLGFTQPSEVGAFLKSQRELFKKQTGREPKSTREKAE